MKNEKSMLGRFALLIPKLSRRHFHSRISSLESNERIIIIIQSSNQMNQMAKVHKPYIQIYPFQYILYQFLFRDVRPQAKIEEISPHFCSGNFVETDTFLIISQWGNGNFRFP